MTELNNAVKNVPILIDGKFLKSDSQIHIPVTNPASQEILAHVPICTKNEILNAMRKQN